jgi:hypothetical protein
MGEKTTFIGLKASRVRANGIQKKEKFLHFTLKKIKDLRHKFKKELDREIP